MLNEEKIEGGLTGVGVGHQTTFEMVIEHVGGFVVMHEGFGVHFTVGVGVTVGVNVGVGETEGDTVRVGVFVGSNGNGNVGLGNFVIVGKGKSFGVGVGVFVGLGTIVIMMVGCGQETVGHGGHGWPAIHAIMGQITWVSHWKLIAAAEAKFVFAKNRTKRIVVKNKIFEKNLFM